MRSLAAASSLASMSAALAPAVGAPRRAAAPPRCQALPTHGPSSPPPPRRAAALGSRRCVAHWGGGEGARVAALSTSARVASADLSGEELDALFDEAVPGSRRSAFRSLLAARRVARHASMPGAQKRRWRPRLTPALRRAARKPSPTWRLMRPGPAGWPWCAPRGGQRGARRGQRRRRMQRSNRRLRPRRLPWLPAAPRARALGAARRQACPARVRAPSRPVARAPGGVCCAATR